MKQSLLTTLLAFGAMMMFAQNRTLTGKILDGESGEPLYGATVLAQGTSNGTIADIDGNFSLTVPTDTKVLLVSYTGYNSQEIAIGASNVIDITMAPNVTALNEIVVVGYGTQIKSTLTGNIAKLDGDRLKDLPVSSMEQGLQGKTAGVFIESANGKPGGAVRVRIRGAGSITASNQPLYIVDGVPISVDAQNISGGALNPLADLNPNDIESVEILKDASAGAIYGSRAANGVVLITTRKGKAGKTNIEANFQMGSSTPTGKREFLNREQYIQMFTRSVTGAATYEYALDPSAWTDEAEAIDWYVENYATKRFNRYSGPGADYTTTTTNTNWQDQAFADNPVSSQASIAASGGTDKTKFYASAAWNKQEGILIGNNFERMSARLNLDQAASKRLNFGINMSLARTFTDQVSDDNQFSTPMQLVALSPLTPPRDADGVLYDRPTTTYYNGLIDQEDANRDVTSFRTLANSYVRLKLAEGLLLNGDLGVDVYNLRDNAFYGSRTDGGNASNGYGSSLYSQIVNFTPKTYLNYDKAFGAQHHLSLTGGMEYQQSRNDVTRVEGQEFPVDDLKTLASAATITIGTSSITEFSFLSYFARANYDFDRKYLLSLSARADGSSRFGKNNRYGYFPAVSAGWVLSEEDFLADNDLISFLKIRASYGKTGNAAIGNFQHLGLYGANSYAGVSGLAPSQIPNPDLKWEKTTQTDFGLDFGLFDNRLNGEIDYYIKNTTDLLLNVPVPSTTGFESQTKNVGEVENKGWEFVINSNNLVGDFKWTTSFNIALNKNKVKSLSAGQDLIDLGLSAVKVGESIGVFYGAEYAGVDPANGDALWYKNGENTGRETTNDYSEAEYVVIGNPNPDFIGGITNSFSWKGISLDVLFQGVYGNEIYKDGDRFMACQACWFDNQTTDQLKHWDKPGDITKVPEPRFWYSNGDQSRNSRYVSDGSYLRLKTLTIGYELPRSILENIGLSRLRLYVIGQNLMTFTKYDGWDPEVSSDAFSDNVASGIDFYSAPQPKTIAFGINVGF
ncbi:MAG: TonB-dependent receptor [Bacteroidales bacterium]|nr:TonB-dependent receptor [Bacteroidales bacterium]